MPCTGGDVTLDGSATTGPGTLSYSWSALTPGLTFTSPTSAVTPANATGAGPWTVSLTVTNGLDTSTCVATVDIVADVTAPVVDCVARIDAVPTAPGGTQVAVTATATDDCLADPPVTNDRTTGGADATDLYPCGETLVTFSATDGAGHVATCVTSVVVADLPPDVACAGRIDAVPTSPAGAFVRVDASATDICDGALAVVNDRTAGGGDASDTYPCGETLVTFTAMDAAGQVTSCVTRVVVMSLSAPVGVSEGPGEPWLRVARNKIDPALLDVTMQLPADPAELVNLYAGTIRRTGVSPYDHVPVSCHALPVTLAAGVGLLNAPLDAGSDHYYLASASNCLAEGTRGSRSDGVPRPDLASDCGALP